MRSICFLVLMVVFSGECFVTARPTFDKIAEVLIDMIDPPQYRPPPPPEKYHYPARPIHSSRPIYSTGTHYPAGYQGGYNYGGYSQQPIAPGYHGYQGGQNYNGYSQRPIAPQNPEYYPNYVNGPHGAPNYGYRPGYENYGYRNPALDARVVVGYQQ